MSNGPNVDRNADPEPDGGAIAARLQPLEDKVAAEIASHRHVRAVVGQIVGIAITVVDPLARAAILAAAGPLVGGLANGVLAGGESFLKNALASGQLQIPRAALAAVATDAAQAGATALVAEGHGALASTALALTAEALRA